MALFNVTVKRTATINGVHIEKGMSVEVVTRDKTNPINNQNGKELIHNAFMQKYGVDLKKISCLSSGTLDVEQIN